MNLIIPRIPLFDDLWIQVRDGDPTGLVLYERHYSKRQYKDGRKPNRFVGPGERIVLVTQDGKAMFVWRKFISDDNQKGINCAIFRNEGPLQSSELILAAEQFAQARWPNERLYTYVNPQKIKSTNPGYCFKMAGWYICGKTKIRKLIIMEKFNEQSNVQNS